MTSIKFYQRSKSAIFTAVLLILILAQACNKNDDVDPSVDARSSNVLILNEGLFRRGNASISGYDPNSNTSLGVVYDPASGSGGALDILQSSLVLGDTILLVANNSNSIVLLDHESLQERGRFEGLGSPRYIARMQGGNFLVTDLFANRLLELDSNFSQVRSIQHTGQAEGVIAFGEGALFVSPERRMIFFFNALLGKVTDSLSLPFRVNSLQALDDSTIAVCGGILQTGESGGLSIINWADRSINPILRFSESESSLYPRLLRSGEHLYCLQRGLHILPLDNLHPSAVETIPLEGIADPYGLGVDPESGDIYVADAKNGLALGEVLRINNQRIGIDTFPVGVFPNGFIFR